MAEGKAPPDGRRLTLVPTPIGNLGDMTLRALDVLRRVDAVAAEDTRRTRVLLDHHGITARLERLDARSEERRVGEERRYRLSEHVEHISKVVCLNVAD